MADDRGGVAMITGIVLAAGLSRRMGQPKLILRWGDTTVIGQVVSVLVQAGLEEILVISGGAHLELEAALSGKPARLIFNPRHAEDQMILSLQAGLREASDRADAALLALGDQPQIELDVARAVIDCFGETRAELVVPSYQMRRGHPVLVARSLWPELLSLQPPVTLRDYLNAHPDRIYYLNVQQPSILKDLDTPEDYYREMRKSLPGANDDTVF